MYAVIEGVIGSPKNGLLGLTPDTSAAISIGISLKAVDPWWGGGEFTYGRANGTIRTQGMCVCTPVFDSTMGKWRHDFTEVPNTASLARPLAVNVNGAMASGDFGWFQTSGIVPIDCQASVAADAAFGIAATGQCGASSANKQIMGGRIVAAGATTVAKANCIGVSGALYIDVPNSDGWFPGVYLSGTGVGSAARVSSIETGGRRVTVSVANSAAIAGTVTATYNNATIFYNVAHISRPIAGV